MDFFARVIMAFCPVICPSSTAAVSSNFTFWLASPRPMFTVIFCSLGTAIKFFQPKRFISAGIVSLRYFSCNRLFIAFPYRWLLLVQCRVAVPATAHLRAVRQHGVADARVFIAASANDQHIRNVDARFFLHDPALDVLLRIRPGVALDDAYVLHHYSVLLCVDGKHTAALAGVFSGDHFHIVTLADGDGVPLGSFMSECHGLPN